MNIIIDTGWTHTKVIITNIHKTKDIAHLKEYILEAISETGTHYEEIDIGYPDPEEALINEVVDIAISNGDIDIEALLEKYGPEE